MRPPVWVALLVVLLAAVPASAAPPTVDARAYVALPRAAEALQSRVEATPDGTQARLTVAGHVVTLTRNWARVLVDGMPVLLDAPVRVRKGVWLVPRTFVAQMRPRLVPAIRLEDVRVRSYPSFTRVVLETTAPLTHRVESTGPGEARVRLLGLAADPQRQSIADGLLDEASIERAGADALLRVALDAPVGEVRASTLADPPRLVLDFIRPVEPLPRARRQETGPLRVIVLDAGHGGHDSGAVGPTGLMEKDLVLDVTRRVARLVEDQLGIKVLLSRDGDYFVPLRDRTTFANKKRADLFVSIHANAQRDASSAGVETYFLSSEATDSHARQVAAAENSIVQTEKPVAGKGRPDIVKAILWDLAQSEFQLESSRLAEIVQDSMTESLHIPNRGVKQAGFYVLGGAAMPAVLIEIGFVTNPREERRLKDSRYRDDIARAILAGLAEYKKNWDERARAALSITRAARER